MSHHSPAPLYYSMSHHSPASSIPLAAAIVGTCERTSTLVPQDSLQYYQAECSSFTSSVLVELTDLSGASFLYCSTATTNPGPLTSNTVRDERTGVSRRQCQLSIPPGTEVRVYYHCVVIRTLCILI